MKKFMTFALLLSFGLTAQAADFGMPMGNLMNDVGNMQNTNSQLKLLQQQRFRQEEYDDFQDLKEVKEKRNKKIELEQEYAQVQQQQKQQRSIYNNSNDVDFVRENGKIILKRIN